MLWERLRDLDSGFDAADRRNPEHEGGAPADVAVAALPPRAYEREEPVGPSDEERARFAEFAKRRLSADT